MKLAVAFGIMFLFGCHLISCVAAQTTVDIAETPDITIDLKINRLVTENVEPTLPILQEQRINDYVQRIGALVVRAVPLRLRHDEFRYTFKVVDSSGIAIYAIPGGAVYLSRGLLEILSNEGELVGIIAHGITHIASRDYVKRLPGAGDKIQWREVEEGIRCSFFPNAAGCVDPKKHKMRYGNYVLTFSHVVEGGTDLVATEIVARTGYDPDDLGNVWGRIGFDKLKAGNCFNDPYSAERQLFIYQDAKDLRQRKIYDPNKVPYMSEAFLEFKNLINRLSRTTIQ